MIEPVNRRMANVVSVSWGSPHGKRVTSNGEPSITLEAPLLDLSGYATSTRNLVKGLCSAGAPPAIQPRWFKGAVSVSPLTVEEMKDDHLVLEDLYGNLFRYLLWIPRKEVEYFMPLISEPISRKNFIIHMAPYSYGLDHFEEASEKNPGYEKYIGSTMYETDRLPKEWVSACNRMDQVWVPTEFNVGTFSKSGVDASKIRKVPLGVDTTLCRPGMYPRRANKNNTFVFLSVFEWARRKGWDILLEAFCRAFSMGDNVELLIRASAKGEHGIKKIVNEFFKEKNIDSSFLSKIKLMDHPINTFSLYSLYESCDAFVLPSRGEGWGMPYLEAMAFGKPVIGTNWGGNTEFMTNSNSFLIESEKEEELTDQDLMDNPCLLKGHKYAKPSLDHLVELMRTVYKDETLRQRIAQHGLRDAHEKWNHVNYAATALKSL